MFLWSSTRRPATCRSLSIRPVNDYSLPRSVIEHRSETGTDSDRDALSAGVALQPDPLATAPSYFLAA